MTGAEQTLQTYGTKAMECCKQTLDQIELAFEWGCDKTLRVCKHSEEKAGGKLIRGFMTCSISWASLFVCTLVFWCKVVLYSSLFMLWIFSLVIWDEGVEWEEEIMDLVENIGDENNSHISHGALRCSINGNKEQTDPGNWLALMKRYF